MAKKRYYLDKDKTQLLELKWTMGWKMTYVLFNSQQIAVVTRDEITMGKTLELPDGRNLELKLDKGLFTTLVSKIDGKHIVGSMGDPVYQLKQVFYLLLFLGIVNAVIGFLFAMNDIQIDGLEGIGYMNVALGLVEIALGYAISKGSMPALILATILMAADLVLTGMYAADNFRTGLYMKIFFLVFIIRGFKYIKEYKELKS